MLGRPIPFSSSSFTSDASVYLAGGWENFCSCSTFSALNISFALTVGMAASSSALSSRPSVYIAV